ncbi:hypothetical protein [Nonomuraea maritima]|uniref:hypothetical protein n=1 Tax=Nonomuraea maritima TaxID=683260 RepID=UPI00115FDA97|nr:hypothetical protein [Nonomuraea maritima]
MRDAEAAAAPGQAAAQLPPTVIEPSPATTAVQPARHGLLRPLVALGVAIGCLAGAIVFVTTDRGDPSTPIAAATEQAAAAASSAPPSKTPPAPSPPSPSSPPETVTSQEAHEQALAIDDLLDESKPSRGSLTRAIQTILRCSNVDSGIKSIERVTRQRAEQAAAAGELDTDALASGQQLESALVEALTASHRADQAYLKWAKRYKAHDCTGPTVGDADYDAGNVASEEATAAKTEFVDLWNPVARQEGLAERTEDEI